MGNTDLLSNEHESRQHRRYIWEVWVDLYLSPSRAFRAIDIKPRWIWAFMVCSLVLMCQIALTSNQRAADFRRAVQSNRSLSIEEVQQGLDYINEQAEKGFSLIDYAKLGGLVGSVQLIKVLTLAATLWLALGATTAAPFHKILALTSVCFLILVPETALKVPLMWLKNSKEVYISLAALLPQGQGHTWLFRVLNEIDVFNIWMLTLLTMGVRIIAGCSTRRAIMTVGIMWTAWILIRSMVGGYNDLL